MTTPLAHGIGGVRDLPVPESFFFTTAAIVLVVSFILLGALWRRPLLELHAEGRRPRWLQAVLLSRVLRVALQAFSVALLALVLATALFGTTIPLLNFAPTFVYVIFWLGLPLLSVTLGDVWRVLSPWRAIADAAVWAIERMGRQARPIGMAVYGRHAWMRGGEGFAVAFGLLARIARFAARDGAIVVRRPLTGLAGAERVPGTLLFVAVMLGSTSFDGFSRTSTWQNLLGDVRAYLADESQRVLDLATTLVNVAGLAAFVAAVMLTYLAAVVVARRLVNAPRSLIPDFVLPLVPIAFAYLVAHYFSLFVIQGQFIVTLASDPFGRDWDLLGTADFVPNLTVVSPETVWYVQVVALTVGHVSGLAIAHDRAVALFEDRGDALRSQYPMLALMVLYTVGGLWLLSQG